MNDLPRWITFLPILLVMACGVCTPFVILVVALIFVGRQKKNVETSFTRLAASLGGQMRSSAFNALPIFTGKSDIQGRHHDVPYVLSYVGPSQGSRRSQAARITIVIPVKPLFTLSLRKENLDTKLSKRIGMATELEIGVPDFDTEFFIRTNDPTSCRNYLSVPKHRAAIRHIYHKGFMLTLTRKHVELRKYVSPPLAADTELVEAAEIKGILNAVVVLVKGL